MSYKRNITNLAEGSWCIILILLDLKMRGNIIEMVTLLGSGDGVLNGLSIDSVLDVIGFSELLSQHSVDITDLFFRRDDKGDHRAPVILRGL